MFAHVDSLAIDKPVAELWKPDSERLPDRGSAMELSRSLDRLGVLLSAHTGETQETDLLHTLPDLSSLVTVPMEEPASIGPADPVEHAAVASASGIGPRVGGEGAVDDSEDNVPSACGPSPLRQRNHSISAMDCIRSQPGASSGGLETPVSLPKEAGPEVADSELESADLLLPRTQQDELVLSSSVYAALPLPTPYRRMQRQFRSSIGQVKSTTDLLEGVSGVKPSGSELCNEQCGGGSLGARDWAGSIRTTSYAAFSRRGHGRAVTELKEDESGSDMRLAREDLEARKLEQVLPSIVSQNHSWNVPRDQVCRSHNS